MVVLVGGGQPAASHQPWELEVSLQIDIRHRWQIMKSRHLKGKACTRLVCARMGVNGPILCQAP